MTKCNQKILTYKNLIFFILYVYKNYIFLYCVCFIFVRLMKIIRLVILICLFCVSVYVGWYVYSWVYDLLDFQLGMYSSFLEAWKKVDAVQDSLWWIVEQALWLFWGEFSEWSSWENFTDEQVRTISDKIASFEKKLNIISWIIWWLAWLLVWKFLSDIVFWMKKTVVNIQKFIG